MKSFIFKVWVYKQRGHCSWILCKWLWCLLCM